MNSALFRRNRSPQPGGFANAVFGGASGASGVLFSMWDALKHQNGESCILRRLPNHSANSSTCVLFPRSLTNGSPNTARREDK